METIGLADFSYMSERAEDCLFRILLDTSGGDLECQPSTEIGWFSALAFFRLAFAEAVHSWKDHILLQRLQPESPVEFQPWQGCFDRVVICPTAHECAANLWIVLADELIQNDIRTPPGAGSRELAAAVDEFMRKHVDTINRKTSRLRKLADHREVQRLLARMRAERLLLIRSQPETNAGESDSPEAPDSGPEGPREKTDDIMRQIYGSERDSIGWTAGKWIDRLAREGIELLDDSTVRKTDTWKIIQHDRKLLRQSSQIALRRGETA